MSKREEEGREAVEISNGRDGGEMKTKKISKGRKIESRRREYKNYSIRRKKRESRKNKDRKRKVLMITKRRKV